MGALRGIRIIELAEGVAGEYCGKLLSDLGAEVIKIERPVTGSPTRRMAPIVGDGDGPEQSGLFAYLNTNKKSVVLDLSSAADLSTLHNMIADADAVIDDHRRDWAAAVGVSPEEAQRRHPSILFCSITPYGQDAPDEMQNDKSLNIFNSSGWGYHTPSEPDPAKPPLKGAGRFLVDYEAGLSSALSLASSLFWRLHTGQGQFIDVSQLEVMVSRADSCFGAMLAGEEPVSHDRRGFDMPGPSGFFACEDGFVHLFISTWRHWKSVKELIGNPESLAGFEDNWLEFGITPEKIAIFRRAFGAWVRGFRKESISIEAQQVGVPLVPLNDALDLQQSPQILHRGFFQNIAHPVLGEALYPTVPYKLDATPARIVQAAPLLGQHTVQFTQRGTETGRRTPPAPKRDQRKPGKYSRGGPLAGIRVVELTKVWAGPYAGKLLALLGAEVIKIESNSTLDDVRLYGGANINHAPIFLSINPEILSLQLNLKTEAGLGYLRALIAKSDIVINNIRPGAMERQGLGAEGLRAIKSDIISVSIKMYGNDGPWASQTGFAPSFASLGGPNALVGHEGGPPLGMNIRYGDSTAGAAAAFAAVAALVHRELTGEGQFVDVSAVETMASMIGDCLLEQNLTGRMLAPDGNRHADMAPHGCYPCAGGEWISIAVASDVEWQNLCAVLGRPDLAKDSSFFTLQGRQATHERLDRQLSELTAPLDARTLAAQLRAAGVGASKSVSSQDLARDERLWSRGVFRPVTDKLTGERPVVTIPWQMSRTPTEISRGAPDVGEHNDYVFEDLLGVSREQLQELVAQKIVD